MNTNPGARPKIDEVRLTSELHSFAPAEN